MQIYVKFTDTVADLPQQGEVPVVTIDMASNESVDGMTEPTPAMWTAACVYELFTSGKLIEMTKEFIERKNAEPGATIEVGTSD